MSGNVKLAMSHVVPDLVQKVVKGQDPLYILGDGSHIRHYTYGGDLAETSTSVLELAELIWYKVRVRDVPFRYVSNTPFEHDVAKRVPAADKAKTVPGFEATTSLDAMLDEVIPWIERAVADGTI